jgi:type 1 glutamine amidotransferase
MTRRQMLARTGAGALALGLLGAPAVRAADAKKVLFFSRSQGFEHSVIKRKDGELSHAEKILQELGPKHGIEFTFSKDGGLFTKESLAKFDAFFFYTTLDLAATGGDNQPPMPPEGKAALLDAIKSGKGFIGTHSASDTFHTLENKGETQEPLSRYRNYGDKADPYIKMLGGEFIKHGAQQKSTMRVVDPKFPGLKSAGAGFEMHEEWYSLKDFAKDLHVILVQETSAMTGLEYKRPPYPATWARKHGQGRVFFTSMGHREDVWTNPVFQEILFGGIAWAVHNAEADITPNIDQVTPQAAVLPSSGSEEPPKKTPKPKPV